ncbi:MAG: hypothetical protein EXR39_14290 [Betaproteobacteria bacterium]|nr:hypothetical protein [Betaproteobacteria bacterium]
MNQPGQSCPLHYRYLPTVFSGPASHVAETAYIIGGLYGNPEALRTILKMRDDEARAGRGVSLVFNGDFNWFNVDASGFRLINETVLAHIAIKGNVEAEIGAPSDSGCGCNYPDYVDSTTVARSNDIMTTMQSVAAGMPDLCDALNALPLVLTMQIGDARVGVVHGDAESLAGWSFAQEQLVATRAGRSEDVPSALTSADRIMETFRAAKVCAFASTHTCLPIAKDYMVDGQMRLIINNGAAGMPNFAGTTYGVITRISTDCAVPPNSLYGIELGGVRFDALPVHYDQLAWVKQFIANWPTGSPAHASYFDCIRTGPRFQLSDAASGRVGLVHVRQPAHT